MKEEGFMNKALNKIKEKDIKARFILNQSAFNLPDNSKVSATTRAAISFAILIQEQEYNDLYHLATKAANVKTVGNAKKIIAEAEKIIENREE